jgi:hypothetical protein
MPTYVDFGPPFLGPAARVTPGPAQVVPDEDGLLVQESLQEVATTLTGSAVGWAKLNMYKRKDNLDSGTTEVWVNSAHVRFIRERG